MNKKLLYFAVIIFLPLYSLAQNVGIGTTTPHNSAALDISSTNKGILVPRMNSTQRANIPGPVEGLMVTIQRKMDIFLHRL